MENLSGPLAGVRRKVLFGQDGDDDPKAQIWQCPAKSVLQRDTAPFGEYQVLVEGSAWMGDRLRKPYTTRYVLGDETPTPLTAGPEGATWLIVTFGKTG